MGYWTVVIVTWSLIDKKAKDIPARAKAVCGLAWQTSGKAKYYDGDPGNDLKVVNNDYPSHYAIVSMLVSWPNPEKLVKALAQLEWDEPEAVEVICRSCEDATGYTVYPLVPDKPDVR